MKTEQAAGKLIQEFQIISDNKLLRIIDEMLEGVQIFDENLNYLYINKAAEKQNQRSNKELIGKRYEDSWPGIEDTQVYNKIRQCLAEQRSIYFENEFKFPDDSIGWFYLSIQPISEGILILSLDITSRMILGQEIANRERLYNSLFENLVNGFAYCKIEYQKDQPVDFHFINVNEAFEKIFSCTDLIGKRVSEVIPEIHNADPHLLTTFSRVAETSQPETIEIYLETLGMWLCVSVYSPEKGYFAALFEVITARKISERKLKDQLDELQRWYQVSIDREQRSIELKKEVNQLLIKLGQKPKYTMIDKTEDK